MSRYDFDLKTGKIETGLVACTYAVEVKHDSADGLDKVYVETPKGGTSLASRGIVLFMKNPQTHHHRHP
ncbi:hypothetical protein K443DRAFT_680678 [Laccaria amethystina LaAM-08-1]|uniref:Unplaced genomic scaffold K443scaffold_131, whole genome shotgun sequence n=1 Tax=Laccaria amethystina LaAM-08-1 TaxID=1095629 RepID=A0A0C9X0B3_9AGAR|nr:hypothetical protein K443DRAFT_680678 [Laccaria amethystina LaAM-08-1]